MAIAAEGQAHAVQNTLIDRSSMEEWTVRLPACRCYKCLLTASPPTSTDKASMQHSDQLLVHVIFGVQWGACMPSILVSEDKRAKSV